MDDVVECEVAVNPQAKVPVRKEMYRVCADLPLPWSLPVKVQAVPVVPVKCRRIPRTINVNVCTAQYPST